MIRPWHRKVRVDGASERPSAPAPAGTKCALHSLSVEIEKGDVKGLGWKRTEASVQPSVRARLERDL